LYYEALRERKFKEAKESFDKVLEKETNPKKRKEEIIRNFYWRHSYGDTFAFNELENYTLEIENDNDVKSVGLYYLSLVYKEANNYEKAIDLASKALEITTNSEQKSYCISKYQSII
jgi:tetratricopeptide (TPR) repeat protein